jgi:NAD(P)-dependent dehydrogenase (short-subunit alcohol dehydrogenase family)
VAYGQSKCCNLLFAKGLAQKLERDQHAGLTAMSVHPGVIKTALWKNTAVSNWAIVSWIADTFIMDKSIPQGAATTLFAALCPEASQKEYRGAYLSDCAIAQPKGSSATNAELVGRLWDETERQLADKVKSLNSK